MISLRLNKYKTSLTKIYQGKILLVFIFLSIKRTQIPFGKGRIVSDGETILFNKWGAMVQKTMKPSSF